MAYDDIENDFNEGLEEDFDGDPGSAGQSGATQGLSDIPGVASDSVEELAESGQGYEADVVQGFEDAADHPEEPVPVRDELT